MSCFSELSGSIQDYLKEIYKLEEENGRATTSAIAGRMGVAAPSVTAVLKRLTALGLVRHQPYRGAVLTPAGEKVAIEVIRHHRLLEQYLAQTLGLEIDAVHAEADRLEHALSEELEARIDASLGYPTHDPHGDPIPDANLRLTPSKLRAARVIGTGRGGDDPSHPGRVGTPALPHRPTPHAGNSREDVRPSALRRPGDDPGRTRPPRDLRGGRAQDRRLCLLGSGAVHQVPGRTALTVSSYHPRMVSRPVLQFAVSGLLALVVVGIGAFFVLRSQGDSESVRDARRLTRALGTTAIEPALTDRLARGDPAAVRRLDRLVRSRVVVDPVVRVKIWTRTGASSIRTSPG